MDHSEEAHQSSEEDETSKPITSATLEEFRNEWRKEIGLGHNLMLKGQSHGQRQTPQEQAEILFNLGVENEENGKLYEAIQFYKKAVSLVPDIEHKLFKMSSTQAPKKEIKKEEELCDESEDENGSEEDEFDPQKVDLISHLNFIRLKNQQRAICVPKLPTNITHFSALPMEVFLYILHWVVSSELDLRSLDMCSMVCRGFYIGCRDQEIWRTACSRVWGLNCGKPGSLYLNWRRMFLDRPRPHYNGCYISTTTYVRHGETTFQDHDYRPWHLVHYYRIVRFFPDGRVLMMTTPEEPQSCVGVLRNRHPVVKNPPITSGYFKLVDSKLTLVVSPLNEKKRNSNNSHTFHIELEISKHRNRPSTLLEWRRYEVYTLRNGVGSDSTFDLPTSRYPPFKFSRVKSYTVEAEKPLCNMMT